MINRIKTITGKITAKFETVSRNNTPHTIHNLPNTILNNRDLFLQLYNTVSVEQQTQLDNTFNLIRSRWLSINYYPCKNMEHRNQLPQMHLRSDEFDIPSVIVVRLCKDDVTFSIDGQIETLTPQGVQCLREDLCNGYVTVATEQ